VLRLNTFDPQSTAKPDTHAQYAYDDVKSFTSYYMRLGSTGEHRQLLSIRRLPPEWSSRQVALNPLKTRRGGWF
jgi:hypothetical protein